MTNQSKTLNTSYSSADWLKENKPYIRDKQKNNSDNYTRIPVTLKDDTEREMALAIKQAVELREGRSMTWAAIVRLALRELAKKERVKCL